MKELTLAFSTCPNDTFIFFALVNNKLKDMPFNFKETLLDIEELNNQAFNETYDITKISFNALGYLQDKYILLDSGAALGENCGPLLIGRDFCNISELEHKVVGIPGKYTTANFLFDLINTVKVKKVYMRFDKIIPSILNGIIDAGVIIHESRFTYKQCGLKKIVDLGEKWEKLTGSPIPLGGIAVRKSIAVDDIKKIDFYLKKSIKYAYENFDEVKNYIKDYAQEMEDSVIQSHINLYVNNYTYSLGEKGIEAVKNFYYRGYKSKIFEKFSLKICGANGCFEIGQK